MQTLVEGSCLWLRDRHGCHKVHIPASRLLNELFNQFVALWKICLWFQSGHIHFSNTTWDILNGCATILFSKVSKNLCCWRFCGTFEYLLPACDMELRFPMGIALVCRVFVLRLLRCGRCITCSTLKSIQVQRWWESCLNKCQRLHWLSTSNLFKNLYKCLWELKNVCFLLGRTILNKWQVKTFLTLALVLNCSAPPGVKTLEVKTVVLHETIY